MNVGMPQLKETFPMKQNNFQTAIEGSSMNILQ